MDEKRNAEHWEENAPTWAKLARLGYDRSRDLVNSPAFFGMLPEVSGLRGVDVGCGEGYNTRLLAERGARMVALDIARNMIGPAQEEEARAPRGIGYLRASALALPFGDGAFDFATAFMSLMDMPGQRQALGEIRRVLRPGGFLQFSITHPCFHTPAWEWLRGEKGERRALVVGDYFRELDGEIEEWTFGAAQRDGHNPPKFRVPRFTHTLSTWMNLLVDLGFVIERMCEPTLDAATLAQHPDLYDHAIIAYFLIVRVRRPLGNLTL